MFTKEIIFRNTKPSAPDRGYNLELWNQSGYRATAIAYMQRENINRVANVNGYYYTLNELKNAAIGYKNNEEATK